VKGLWERVDDRQAFFKFDSIKSGHISGLVQNQHDKRESQPVVDFVTAAKAIVLINSERVKLIELSTNKFIELLKPSVTVGVFRTHYLDYSGRTDDVAKHCSTTTTLARWQVS